MGRTPGSGGSCRYIVLGCLSDMEWRTTAEVARMAGVSRSCAYQVLLRLERADQAIRRSSGNEVQWCWGSVKSAAILIEGATAKVPL